MPLGYSPIGCCVPGVGLETSNPRARALWTLRSRLGSTRLDSTRPGWGAEMTGGPTPDIGRGGEERRWGVADTAVGVVGRANSLVEARK